MDENKNKSENQDLNFHSEIPPIPEIENFPEIPEMNFNNTINDDPSESVNNTNFQSQNSKSEPHQENKGFGEEHFEYIKQKQKLEDQQYENLQLNKQQYAHQNKNFNSQSNIPPQYPPYYFPVAVPNSGAILTLGILSLISICCCGAFLSPIFSVIALIMSSKAIKIYKQNPAQFTKSSYNNINTGKICAIIGLILSVVLLLIFIINMIYNGEFYYEVNKIVNETWNQTNY